MSKHFMICDGKLFESAEQFKCPGCGESLMVHTGRPVDVFCRNGAKCIHQEMNDGAQAETIDAAVAILTATFERVDNERMAY